MEQTFFVRLVVEGRYEVKVEAKDIKEAENKAVDMYENADFGELSDIDGYVAYIEDESGNRLAEY